MNPNDGALPPPLVVSRLLIDNLFVPPAESRLKRQVEALWLDPYARGVSAQVRDRVHGIAAAAEQLMLESANSYRLASGAFVDKIRITVALRESVQEDAGVIEVPVMIYVDLNVKRQPPAFDAPSPEPTLRLWPMVSTPPPPVGLEDGASPPEPPARLRLAVLVSNPVEINAIATRMADDGDLFDRLCSIGGITVFAKDWVANRGTDGFTSPARFLAAYQTRMVAPLMHDGDVQRGPQYDEVIFQSRPDSNNPFQIEFLASMSLLQYFDLVRRKARDPASVLNDSLERLKRMRLGF